MLSHNHQGRGKANFYYFQVTFKVQKPLQNILHEIKKKIVGNVTQEIKIVENISYLCIAPLD